MLKGIEKKYSAPGRRPERAHQNEALRLNPQKTGVSSWWAFYLVVLYRVVSNTRTIKYRYCSEKSTLNHDPVSYVVTTFDIIHTIFDTCAFGEDTTIAKWQESRVDIHRTITW